VALRSCVTSLRCGRSRGCVWCSSRRRPAWASACAAAATGDALPPDCGGGNGDDDGDGGGCGGGAAATAGGCAQLIEVRATLRGAAAATLVGLTDAAPSVGAAVVVTKLTTSVLRYGYEGGAPRGGKGRQSLPPRAARRGPHLLGGRERRRRAGRRRRRRRRSGAGSDLAATAAADADAALPRVLALLDTPDAGVARVATAAFPCLTCVSAACRAAACTLFVRAGGGRDAAGTLPDGVHGGVVATGT